MGKPKNIKAYTTPWAFPFDTPQLPKYGYDRPANLPPPAPSIYDPDIRDIKEPLYRVDVEDKANRAFKAKALNKRRRR